MHYNFSAEFVRVLPPDTSFGDAWESLCYDLLVAELNDLSLLRMQPPDKGIDIWHRDAASAYQCKSDERGALGSLSAADSIDSLRAAASARSTLNWTSYLYATNANYTGTVIQKILEEGRLLGVDSSQIQFRGPEYWSALCEKHCARVAGRLDYRINVTAEQVVEAFRKARYYDEYVKKFQDAMHESSLVLRIKNNWTPVELEVPFSTRLNVENCVDAVQELLGVSLKWTNFSDLGTSTGPSLSLTVDRRGQAFSQAIGDVEKTRGEKDLVFWITILWKDKTRDDGTDAREMYRSRLLPYDFLTVDRASLAYEERRKQTLERGREMLQAMIWKAAAQLKRGRLPITDSA